MTLTLVIRNAAALENGMPTEFVLHERGAVIGRADTCDWSLPDPQRHISSRHCEVRFHDGSYWLTDTSTNGTFVNNSADPLQGEHRIEQGDVILVGDFEIGAELSGSAAAEPEGEPGAQEAFAGWDGWGDGAPPVARETAGDEWGEPQQQQPQPAAPESWEPSIQPGNAAPEARQAIAGPAAHAPGRGFEWGERRPVAEEVPSTDGWGPTHDASDMPDGSSVWEGPKAAADPSSGWSSPAADAPRAAGPADIWGQIAEDNVVDWARGGFGAPVGQQPWGHQANGTPVKPGPKADNPPGIGPAGTVHCTLADWAKFVAFHLTSGKSNPGLLKPESFDTMHTSADGQYAMGWLTAKRPWAGGTALTHAGSNTMWYCVAWLAPKKNFAVLVMINQGGDGASRAADDVASALIMQHK